MSTSSKRPGTFRRGHDRRRHVLTRKDRAKGGYITTWLYIHVSWEYAWTRDDILRARSVWAAKNDPPW
jgi:hypothetical protein